MENSLSAEETYLVQRSSKKVKRKAGEHQVEDSEVEMVESMETESIVAETPPENGLKGNQNKSYCNVRKGRSSRTQNYGTHIEDDELVSDDDQEDSEEEDESCPLILLSKDEKRRLRMPWKYSLIIKLFDKRLSYAVLIRRLKLMWNLKGEIALTDVGCAFYVARFTSMADYDFIMTQGPWMIGESYLTIRKWVPNFVPDEEPIKKLTAWVRIPNLSVEYFDRTFLQRIGEKIGRVVRIDKNTESMDRGQYIRFCIEVDLSKPLLSKFRSNGRVWRIQYEGLRQICLNVDI